MPTVAVCFEASVLVAVVMPRALLGVEVEVVTAAVVVLKYSIWLKRMKKCRRV
jgi:hypothetical protein